MSLLLSLQYTNHGTWWHGVEEAAALTQLTEHYIWGKMKHPSKDEVQ